MYKMYDWLNEKIMTHLENDVTLIDVGAYHGDFTEQLLNNKKIKKAHLFEPNKKHYAHLENKFSDNKNINLYSCALGNEIGSHNFNCSQDDATGSLLSYHPKYHHEDAGKVVESFDVQVKTLDDVYAAHFPNDKIGLIKIDTQGFDLEVLKGAQNLIKKQKPWLVIELNFLPFYASQAPINVLFNWLMEAGYTIGAFFNDHYSKDQWLGFADGIFIPDNTIEKVLEPFTTQPDSQDLVAENKRLQQICDERLELITNLHNEAEKRLNTINTLVPEMEQLKLKAKRWYHFS